MPLVVKEYLPAILPGVCSTCIQHALPTLSGCLSCDFRPWRQDEGVLASVLGANQGLPMAIA